MLSILRNLWIFWTKFGPRLVHVVEAILLALPFGILAPLLYPLCRALSRIHVLPANSPPPAPTMPRPKGLAFIVSFLLFWGMVWTLPVWPEQAVLLLKRIKHCATTDSPPPSSSEPTFFRVVFDPAQSN